MYVDESGIPVAKDPIKHYLISGVIVRNDKIRELKRSVSVYKLRYFKDEFIEAEIHTQNMYNSKREFRSLVGRDEKYQLLDSMYRMITGLPIVIIAVAIDKGLLEKSHQNWQIFKTAWTILATRYNQYLESETGNDKGMIKIDKSTSKNKKELGRLFEEIRNRKRKYQRIDNIVGEPAFVNSDATEGIQVSDAVSYCITRYLERKSRFSSYWDMIKKCMYVKDGKIFGYGLIVYPPDNTKSGDIQP